MIVETAKAHDRPIYKTYKVYSGSMISTFLRYRIASTSPVKQKTKETKREKDF
jgi:hypothetical protein